MFKQSLPLLILWCLSSWAHAESYIVTKDGKSLWTTSVRKDGESVVYLDKATGEEKNIAVGSVDGIIPRVQTGATYTPDQVSSRIANIKALQSRHQGLLRDLNQLLQEWEALQKGDPGFEKKIDEILARFSATDRLTAAYKGATMDLGMIKFKDVQGKYTAKIDAMVGDIKKQYLAAGFRRLEGEAATNRVSVDDFVACKNLAGALSEAGDAAQKLSAAGLLEKVRFQSLGWNAREAQSGFATAKSIEAFLVSHNTLVRLKTEVAAGADHKQKVETMIDGLIRDAGRAQPLYDFKEKGYPFTRNDKDLVGAMQLYTSRIKFIGTELDEQCMVIPLKRPDRIRMNQSFRVPLRLVFNRAQPKGRIFGVTVLIQGEPVSHTHTVKLEDLTLTNGHAEVTFADGFDQADKAFVPAPGKDGRYAAYVSIAYRISPEGDAEQWCPLSCACRLPM